MTQLTIKLDDSENKLMVEASFEEEAKAVDFDQINKAFKESEFTSLFFDEEQAKNAVAAINEKVTKNLTSQPYDYLIGERRGTKVKIKLASDKMEASAEVIAPYGGKCLTPKQLMKCIAQMNVTMGVMQDAVIELSEKIEQAEPGDIITQKIASGKWPVDGLDSQFEAFTKSARDRILKPQESDHGKVDMKDLGSVISVKEGAELMRRHPPTLGKPGYTVDGETLQPEPGKKLDFEIGEGVVVSPNDPDLLVADMAGLPYVLDNGMRVDNVLTLAGVDVSTGHIDFEGGVVVNGDVTEGMVLKASGDVTVTGFIENATVEVQGDLTVANGIVGRKTDEVDDIEQAEYHCHIKAKGIVAAKYIQYCDIETPSEVHIEKQLMHSKITADKVIGGDEKTPRGKVIGGLLTLKESVVSEAIGAPASTHTTIKLFPRYTEIKSKLSQIAKALHDKEIVLTETRLKYQALKRQPASDKRDEKLKQIKLAYQDKDKVVRRLKAAQKKFASELEVGLYHVKVHASRDMYANVHIHLGKMNINTERDYPTLTVIHRDDELIKLG